MNPNHVVTNNIIMNNYISFGNPGSINNLKANQPQREISVDEIMKYVTRYKNILPHKLNYNFDFKSMLFPFEKNQIIELLNQMDLLIQLLIQVPVESLSYLRIFYFHREKPKSNRMSYSSKSIRKKDM
jgi:hypothetical protein